MTYLFSLTINFVTASEITFSELRLSENTRKLSKLKNPGTTFFTLFISKNKDASAASNWYPACSKFCTWLINSFASSFENSKPNSFALVITLALPASSETVVLV